MRPLVNAVLVAGLQLALREHLSRDHLSP
jgi:hypothetical protein